MANAHRDMPTVNGNVPRTRFCTLLCFASLLHLDEARLRTEWNFYLEDG